jgi:hypothetical protein
MIPSEHARDKLVGDQLDDDGTETSLTHELDAQARRCSRSAGLGEVSSVAVGQHFGAAVRFSLLVAFLLPSLFSMLQLAGPYMSS